MRAILLSCLAAFILIFGLNGLFHTFVAAELYDPHLDRIMLPMAKVNPLQVAIADVVLVAMMAYFTLRRSVLSVQGFEATKTGAAIGLVAAGTYNLINSALIPSWPIVGAIVDVFWHVALGAAGGMLMAWVHNKARRRKII